jgi:hypothetical protein
VDELDALALQFLVDRFDVAYLEVQVDQAAGYARQVVDRAQDQPRVAGGQHCAARAGVDLEEAEHVAVERH